MPESVAFLSDVHFPYHGKKAWPLTLEILRSIQPDVVHLGGDIIDFEPISDFVTEPTKKLTLQKEIDCAVRELTRLREVLPDARFEYREGNHEYRLIRRLFTRAMEFSPLHCMKIPQMLKFDQLEIQWLPFNVRHHIGKLWFIHGHEQPASYLYPARGLYMKLGGNVIAGHFHKFDKHIHREFRGTEHGAWVNGCLSTMNPDYMINAQWRQGFTMLEFSNNGFFKVIPVEFDRKNKNTQQLYARYRGESWES